MITERQYVSTNYGTIFFVYGERLGEPLAEHVFNTLNTLIQL